MKPLNSHFDDDPAGYDALRESWMSSRREGLQVAFLGDLASGGRVLEIGAGTGALLFALARARPDLDFVGVEPLPNYVEFARERAKMHALANVEFRVGTADAEDGLDVRNVDRVVSVDVLHHVDDLGLAVRNVSTACRPAAQWQLIEPNWWNPYILAFQGLTKGERNFRPAKFTRLARTAGWHRRDRAYRLLIPARVKQPSTRLQRFEARFEHVPVAAGAIVVTLDRRGPVT